MNNVINFLAKCASKLHMYELCTVIGIEGLAYRILCRELVNKSDMYFKANKERVERNCLLLADKESVRVYRDAIKYRISRYRHNHPTFNTENQYFPQDIIQLSENEVFVDCGAYTGDTLDAFLRNMESVIACGGEGYKYVAFEPNENDYNQLISKCVSERFIAFKYGVWKESGLLKFYNGEMSGVAEVENNYAKSEENFTEVEVKSIDEVSECQEASFIKMDIEGSEMEALLGAEKVIKRNRPKLAICIYHSDEDMIRIIEYVHRIVPEYKLYVRHHSLYSVETVLYAVLNVEDIKII